MDIFTTQLRRVVQAPIKPSNNKVKAPTKEPASTELTEDFDHLEHHEKRVVQKSEHDQNERQGEPDAKEPQNKKVEESEDDSDKPPHLDIYI